MGYTGSRSFDVQTVSPYGLIMKKMYVIKNMKKVLSICQKMIQYT